MITGFLVSLATAPLVVKPDDFAGLTRPYRPVQRTKRFYIEGRQFGERLLYHASVFADDIGVITPHLLPVFGQVGQRIGHGAVRSSESTERSAEKSIFSVDS